MNFPKSHHRIFDLKHLAYSEGLLVFRGIEKSGSERESISEKKIKENQDNEFEYTVGDAVDSIKNFYGKLYDDAVESVFGESKNARDKLKSGIKKLEDNEFVKDNLIFKEMDFGYFSSDKEDLQKYAQEIKQPLSVKGFSEKINGVKTAAMMIDELPKNKYSPEEKKWLKRYAIATSKIENSHRYNVLGTEIKNENSDHHGDRAIGRYQFMPESWLMWSEEFLNGEVVEPTPQAQEYIAHKKFMQYYNKRKKQYGNNYHMLYTSMANRWHGGDYSEGKISIASEYSMKITDAMKLERSVVNNVRQKYAKAKRKYKKTKQNIKKNWKKVKRVWDLLN